MSASSSKALGSIAVTVAGTTASPEHPRALVTTLEEMVKEPLVQLPGVGEVALAGAEGSCKRRVREATMAINLLSKAFSFPAISLFWALIQGKT